MKITLFTSDKIRHNYLIKLLSKICTNLCVIQETGFDASKTNTKKNSFSKIINEYFKNVSEAEEKIFNENINYNSNTKILKIPFNTLNNISINSNNDYFKSDIYLIYGTSYIKNDLVEFLIKNKALNIHMGVSPYYRGTSCNFWALFDNNPHLVGATIHYISKGLDDGPVVYHAMSNLKSTPLEYSMSTVKSAFISLTEKIKDKSIFKIKAEPQKRSKEIRYTKKIHFNEEILGLYLKKNIDLNSKPFQNSLLKDPFFYN